MGFSLGAHTAGYAGSYLRAHRMQLVRITGMGLKINLVCFYILYLHVHIDQYSGVGLLLSV